MGCGQSKNHPEFTPGKQDGKVDYRAKKAALARSHKHDGPSGRLPASIDEQNKKKQPRVLGIIPARYGSTRFPGKPLADIAGKPMIWHTYTNATFLSALSALRARAKQNETKWAADNPRTTQKSPLVSKTAKLTTARKKPP